ncbi:MAG: hypothetical protein KGJ84_11705 [Elusimicrobia bacterium]|nr:hypothetical protein [Elusimicrobiota bacterium]
MGILGRGLLSLLTFLPTYAIAGGEYSRSVTQGLFFGAELSMIVQGEGKTALSRLENRPELTEPMLYSMYDSLARIESDHSTQFKRPEFIERFSVDYAAFLSSMSTDGRLPVTERKMAEDTRARLTDGSFLREMDDVRRVEQKRSVLESRFRAIDVGTAAQRRAVASPRLPESVRPLLSNRTTLAGLGTEIDEAGAEFDKAEASNRPDAARALGARLESRRVYWRKMLERFSGYALRRSFVDQRPHRSEEVSTHGGIRLRSEAGVFVLTARFATDIRDPAVLAEVKSSIESAWRGEWTLDGRRAGWRTSVEFVPLAPGGEFPSDALRLIDGGDSVTHAGGGKLVLGRGFGHSAPAHEFGHLLGLEDDYVESYDSADRSISVVELPASIMSSPGGRVLPEHFARVFVILRASGLVH